MLPQSLWCKSRVPIAIAVSLLTIASIPISAIAQEESRPSFRRLAGLETTVKTCAFMEVQLQRDKGNLSFLDTELERISMLSLVSGCRDQLRLLRIEMIATAHQSDPLLEEARKLVRLLPTQLDRYATQYSQ